ncbi:MAG: helix-turn-helix domain-containing protein, partial [Candidatus Omnitrophica bacterium]|nr:helix-turn-helix domain-containing protein [Candidatus Omnitrophota bacterium]
MPKYNRLNMMEREDISRLLTAGYSLRKIAKSINRFPSTVSREINRSVVDVSYYRAIFAQQDAKRRRH